MGQYCIVEFSTPENTGAILTRPEETGLVAPSGRMRVGEAPGSAFNREVFVYQLLGDEDPGDYSLQDAHYSASEGSSVGSFLHSFNDRLDPDDMANALHAAGSEPGFFALACQN